MGCVEAGARWGTHQWYSLGTERATTGCSDMPEIGWEPQGLYLPHCTPNHLPPSPTSTVTVSGAQAWPEGVRGEKTWVGMPRAHPEAPGVQEGKWAVNGTVEEFKRLCMSTSPFSPLGFKFLLCETNEKFMGLYFLAKMSPACLRPTCGPHPTVRSGPKALLRQVVWKRVATSLSVMSYSGDQESCILWQDTDSVVLTWIVLSGKSMGPLGLLTLIVFGRIWGRLYIWSSINKRSWHRQKWLWLWDDTDLLYMKWEFIWNLKTNES